MRSATSSRDSGGGPLTAPAATAGDRLGTVLELGVMGVIVLSPLPFGSVGNHGRLALESTALALLALATLRAWRRGLGMPRSATALFLFALLLLGLAQAIPLGRTVVNWVSPSALAIRQASLPDPAAEQAEQQLIGTAPRELDPPAALSVAPQATASAVRTGAAFVALFLVARTVASARGLRFIAVAFLIAGAFQGLYGLSILASGYDHIWFTPKRFYLDSATGTFVNRNHFANYLAMSLALGAAFLAAEIRASGPIEGRNQWIRWFAKDGGRWSFFGLLLVMGLAGLLASFSRAGILLGLAALGATVSLAAGKTPRWRVAAVTLLTVAAAALPLAQLGSDRLAERFVASGADFKAGGGRSDVWLDTMDIVADFPVVGTGLGTFSHIYPLYRSPSVRLFYAHAHNDLLQAVTEMGVLGALLLAGLLATLGVRVVRGLGGTYGVLGVGAAVALVVSGVHALIDFSFHIPANAAAAAVIAGALEGLEWTARG